MTSATSDSENYALTPASLFEFSSGMISDAPTFLWGNAYSVGDRVRYGYNTYECNTEISDDETASQGFVADHWTALDPIQTQIDTISTAISDTTLNIICQ